MTCMFIMVAGKLYVTRQLNCATQQSISFNAYVRRQAFQWGVHALLAWQPTFCLMTSSERPSLLASSLSCTACSFSAPHSRYTSLTPLDSSTSTSCAVGTATYSVAVENNVHGIAMTPSYSITSVCEQPAA